MRVLLASMLFTEGYAVTECRDGDELIDRLYGGDPWKAWGGFDLVISDIRMPAFTGMEVLECLTHSPDPPPVILITAFGDEKTVKSALRMGAAAVLSKPFDMEELKDKVQDVLNSRRACS